MTEKFYAKLPKREPLREDVVGHAREFIDEFEMNITGKLMYGVMGIKPDKTFILTGDPGVGKTYAINAINNSNNIHVPDRINELNEYNSQGKDQKVLKFSDFNLLTFEYDIGKYGTALINMGSRTVQDFFTQAFSYSNLNLNTLIVMDEADALLSSRKNSIRSHAEDNKILETIMKNLQIAHDTDNVYVVMMSNLPEACDEAVLRAGRIDKRIEFKLPNTLERKIGYDKAIEKANNSAQYKVIRGFNSENLAEMSQGFNYADIFQSVERALRTKVKKMIQSKEPGIVKAGYVKQSSLEKAVNEHANSFKNNKKQIGFS